jgi:hypothetical protein
VAAAETVVHYDSCRWRLGRSHDVLKREGHIEDPPLETFDRLDQALAVCRIVAWRPRWLTDLARDQPEAPLSHRLASRRVDGLVCRRHPPPGSAAGAGGSTHRCAVMASPGSKPPVPSPACNYPGCGIPPAHMAVRRLGRQTHARAHPALWVSRFTLCSARSSRRLATRGEAFGHRRCEVLPRQPRIPHPNTRWYLAQGVGKPIGQRVRGNRPAMAAPRRQRLGPAERDRVQKCAVGGGSKARWSGSAIQAAIVSHPYAAKSQSQSSRVPSASTVGMMMAAWRSGSRRSAW